MDLYSGLPYWLIKNQLVNHYNPLKADMQVDVAIIGSGITGALTAHELCRAGIDCAVFDKRMVATGSTAASTSLLQYEIDVPLVDMERLLGTDVAVKAYQASLQAITDIEDVFNEVSYNPDFSRVSSIYLASNKKGRRLLESELVARQQYGLPVTWLDAEALWEKHRLKAPAALKNTEAAQMDCYRAATYLLHYHEQQHGLRVFSPTEIRGYQETKRGYDLVTADGFRIQSRYVVIAAGFEAGYFLPKKVMDLNSTYALISQPVDEDQLWPERSLIWETRKPYFYMRTTSDNRMMIGGADISYKDADRRDRQLRAKVEQLKQQFGKIYPDIPFEVDMAWCGTFSTTKDGLPYIGSWSGKNRMFFALGYGGNGITFSMIAAQVIKHILLGNDDERIKIFGFDRSH
ncbi:NAD(P)/FAD-dependent oxidoreductase [Parapedobacter lycopersici]|uniref:NAD(P)/FAD-dependent oxidoreductase n=1 Tax=Parapedobacter lycopersici TaxID=1864939 RepID=UPI00214D4797|nr:FAD-dependent oxidoreductase [Parapedobacter lycopersici]